MYTQAVTKVNCQQVKVSRKIKCWVCQALRRSPAVCCAAWQQREGRTCGSSPSDTGEESVGGWRSCAELLECLAWGGRCGSSGTIDDSVYSFGLVVGFHLSLNCLEVIWVFLGSGGEGESHGGGGPHSGRFFCTGVSAGAARNSSARV